MSEPFLGEIRIVGFNFAPKGYAFCAGQIMAIAQNSALFSLLGTTYGGNGVTTFALPDLRGRVPMHQGQGSGLSVRSMGQVAGEESHTLSQAEMPAHAHNVTNILLPCSVEDADTGSPNGAYPAVPSSAGGPVNAYAGAASPGKALAGGTAQALVTGQSQPHNNIQPSLVVNFVIALIGIYPTRD